MHVTATAVWQGFCRGKLTDQIHVLMSSNRWRQSITTTRLVALYPGWPEWAGSRKKHFVVIIRHLYISSFPVVHSIFLAHLRDLTIFFCDLSPGFLWPSSRPYTFHFKILILFHSFSSFLNRCPYHLNLCCCITVIISSIPSLSVNSLQENLSVILIPYIHLVILISACWSVNSFSFLTDHVSLHVTYSYTHISFPSRKKWDILIILVSIGTNCLNLFHLLHTFASIRVLKVEKIISELFVKFNH